MKARNRATGVVVAVKVIDKVKHAKHLSAIERELRILRKLVAPSLL